MGLVCFCLFSRVACIEVTVGPMESKPAPPLRPPAPLPADLCDLAVKRDGVWCSPLPALIYEFDNERYESCEPPEARLRIIDSTMWFNTEQYSEIRCSEEARKVLEKLGDFWSIHYGPGFWVGLRKPGPEDRPWDWTVWTWGANPAGQLGDGTTKDRRLPALVKSLRGKMIRSIACGGATPEEGFVIARDYFGRVWAWGCNKYGQLGDGTFQNRTRPVRVKRLTKICGVQCGRAFAVAGDARRRIWTWGDNRYGQLGDGTTRPRNLPEIVKGIPPCVSSSAGYYHVLVTTYDSKRRTWDRLMSWGRNHRGQLGDGTFEDRHRPVWVKLDRDDGWDFAWRNVSGASPIGGLWECLWGEVGEVLSLEDRCKKLERASAKARERSGSPGATQAK